MIDILVGWIYAAATVYFGSKLLDRWEARRLRKQLQASADAAQEPALESLEPDVPVHNSRLSPGTIRARRR